MRHTTYTCNICGKVYPNELSVDSYKIVPVPPSFDDDETDEGFEVLDICVECEGKLGLPFAEEPLGNCFRLKEELATYLKNKLLALHTNDIVNMHIKLDRAEEKIDNSIVDGAKAEPKWGQPIPVVGLNNDVIGEKTIEGDPVP